MKLKYDLGLLNGKVCFDKEIRKTSIAILKNKIIFIGKVDNKDCKKVIDCRGLHVIPGVIDTQVHFREPGLTHKEDISSGTKAAILGGVTTIFEMPNTNPATINKKELDRKILIAKKTSWTNFAFFVGACRANIKKLSKLEKLPGCAGIKMFMGSSTGSLLVSGEKDVEETLKNCNRRIAIHSEDENRLKERFDIINKKNGVSEHEVWRDPQSAVISTKKVIKFAKKHKAKAHVLHISTKEEINLLKNKGRYMTAEVTPQHLTLYAPDCYKKLGTLSQMNPPIRNKSHQNALWKGIRNGIINVIGSDHAPHTLREKKRKWPSSPSGMPGVQTLLPVMLNHVNNRKISLLKLVKLLSTNPSKIYNIKNKGAIKKGYDADITLLNMKKSFILRNKDMATKSKWSPFSGLKVKGKPIATIINGEIKMFKDKIIGKAEGKVVKFD